MQKFYMVALLLGVVYITVVASGRGKHRGMKHSSAGCSEWTFGPCVAKNNGSCIGTKEGTRTGETCQLKTKSFRCKTQCSGCKYSKSTGSWSECDENGKKTITLQLKDGSPSTCPPTKTLVKRCRHLLKRAARGGRREGTGNKCKYNKAPWSECDPATNKKSRTMTLKKGDPATCEATKTVEKQCRNKQKGGGKSRPNRRNKEQI